MSPLDAATTGWTQPQAGCSGWRTWSVWPCSPTSWRDYQRSWEACTVSPSWYTRTDTHRSLIFYSLSLFLTFFFKDVSNNHLRELPSSLGCLTCLQKLNLSQNQLTCLPESMDQLTGTFGLTSTAPALTAGTWWPEGGPGWELLLRTCPGCPCLSATGAGTGFLGKTW